MQTTLEKRRPLHIRSVHEYGRTAPERTDRPERTPGGSHLCAGGRVKACRKEACHNCRNAAALAHANDLTALLREMQHTGSDLRSALRILMPIANRIVNS